MFVKVCLIMTIPGQYNTRVNYCDKHFFFGQKKLDPNSKIISKPAIGKSEGKTQCNFY